MRVIDRRSRPRPRSAAVITVLIILFCLTVGLGLFRRDFLRRLVTQPRAVLVETPRNYLEARLHDSELPELQIDIRFRHYDRLLEKREEALTRGILLTSDTDMVPAEIEHDGRRIRTRMRLKGDWPDHFLTDKWSFRFKVRGGDHVMGMRRFSVQHPEARNYLGEWIYFRNLRDEGVLTPRYEFVRVTVNGDDRGIMALEEHMAKELLESQERREGPIAKFDESAFWTQRMRAKDLGWFPLDVLTYQNTPIDFFGKAAIAENPVLGEQARAARHLLDGFRRGDLPASEVFDVDRMARFLAVSRLWGAHHALIWHNLRFYYNPVSTRLEPIAFDGEPSAWTRRDMWQVRLMGGGDALWIQIHAWDHWTGSLLEDPVMTRAYLEHLHRVSRQDYVDAIQTEYGEEVHDLLLTLRTEWPLLENPLPALHRGAAFLRGKLDPETAVTARRGGAGEPPLQVANVADVPFEVLGVRGAAGTHEFPTPLLLPARTKAEPLVWLPVHDGVAPGDTAAAWIRFRGLGATKVGETPIAEPAPRFVPPRILPEGPSRDAVVARHDFLEPAPDGGVRARPGTWDVEGDLILPVGTRLTIGPGTTLRFDSTAVFLTRGPVEFLGTAEEPVVLEPRDGTWPGFACLGSGAPSRWEHVRVFRTRSIERPGWILTGGVTFYESPVAMEGCVFDGHRGEDALNIIRSDFSLLRCAFSTTASDAFDGDFVTGGIVDCVFRDIGGDGLDVSGSRVEFRGVRARDIVDKAVSIGENSEARLFDIDIRNAGIGIAAKDLSRVLIQGGRITDTAIAIAAYTKKPTYGPAWIEAESLALGGVETPAVVQTGSFARIGEEEFTGIELDVKELYRIGVLGN